MRVLSNSVVNLVLFSLDIYIYNNNEMWSMILQQLCN